MSGHSDSSALDAMFWREEILQVLFWMQGEDLAEAAGLRDLAVFLSGDEKTVAHHLEKLEREGYLVRQSDTDRFALSEQGRQEARRCFADAFEGMQKQGHGECSPDCICKWEGPEACPVHHHNHPHG